MNNILMYLVVAMLFATSQARASQDNIFIAAMKEEIQRGMDNLNIENMPSPYFISYSITDANALYLRAILGGLVESQDFSGRFFKDRVLVGKNGKTNENYLDENNLWDAQGYGDIPFSNHKDDIRRALWLSTDYNYKNAITNYEAKISALSQQSFTDEERNLPDFCAVSRSEVIVPVKKIKINKKKLENTARKLSSVLKKYPFIQESYVDILVYDSQVYFVNSEGTSAQYPFQISAVTIVATTQSSSGEVLNDHVVWFGNNILELPDEKIMIADIEKMAKNISKLTQEKAFEEQYVGPVLFEGQAAAEVFVQKFFTDVNGLIAVRKPVIGSQEILSSELYEVKENELESMMDKKIISRDLTIEALPTLTDFQNISLVGSFFVDAEGVTPPDNLLLVKNGVLKNLLCGRIPTLKMSQSNGHSRLGLNGRGVATVTGPGVIKMTNNNLKTSIAMKKLKKSLLSAAKEEDLEYAYIVRKVVSPSAGIENSTSFSGTSEANNALSKTIQVYRVDVIDGSEKLVALAAVDGLSIRSFKRLLASSKKMQVYNTVVRPVNGNSDVSIPASFILPEGLLFQEVDIVKEKQGIVNNLPIVANPLSSK